MAGWVSGGFMGGGKRTEERLGGGGICVGRILESK